MATLTTLPPSIALLQVLITQMDLVSACYAQDNKLAKQFAEVLNQKIAFDKQDAWLTSPVLIRHLQTLMLAALSLYGGVMVPCLKRVTQKEDHLKITWDSGTTHHFVLGVYDDAFAKFAQYYQIRLSAQPKKTTQIPTSIVRGIYQFLCSYQLIMQSCDKTLTPIINETETVVEYLQKNDNKEVLFIVLSCLPSEQLNGLFIYISQYFPDDLTEVTPNGHRMNVQSLFSSTTSDIQYLIEKLKVYLNL